MSSVSIATAPSQDPQGTAPTGLPSQRAVFVGVGVILVAAFLLELSIGAVGIPLSQVIKALSWGELDRSTWERIILQFRLPRAINAVFSGAALGACGLLLQTLFRNPLADPYVLGIVHGGRLGSAILVVLAGAAGDALANRFGVLGDVTLAAASGIGSVATILAIMTLAPRVNTITLLIWGLMIGYLAQGLISVVLHFTDETQAGAFNAWNDGSFAATSARQLRILIPLVVIGIAVAWVSAKPLNALLLGERYAQSLGVNVVRLRMTTFLATALLTGTVTAYCGPVAFIGLIVAHLGKGLLRTADHRTLMPAVILLGSCVALITDLITHLPWAKHFLHLNAVNGVIGAPLVMWMIARRRSDAVLEQ